ncbi:MAG: Ig-like domain-containing protein [Planctomycetes bacterium]|nr:Ig-like domain-containing protein [Planctomycetota bacterium]
MRSLSRTVRTRLTRPLALGLVLLLAHGCLKGSGPDLEITRPKGGTTVTQTDFEIRVSGNVDPASVRIEVNGTPVPSGGVQIRPESSGATVLGSMDRATLSSGRFNTLSVKARTTGGQDLSTDSNFVWLDTTPPGGILPPASNGTGTGTSTGSTGSSTGIGGSTTGAGLLAGLGGLLPGTAAGPTLSIDSPKMGSFVSTGERFTITGSATDPVGVADLLLALDGAEATSQIAGLDPATGLFVLEARFDDPGLHRIVIAATNSTGGRSVKKVSVYAGEPRPSGDMIEYASQFTLSDKGFYSLGKLIEPILTPEVMYRDVNRSAPIWRMKSGGAKTEITPLGLGHRRLTLDLGVDGALLHIHADLDEMYLSTRFNTKALFVKIKGNTNSTVQRATYDSWCTLDKSPGGLVQIQTIRQSMTLSGMKTKVPGLPSSLVKQVERRMKDYIQSTVEQILSEQVPALLAKRLNEFFMLPQRRELEILGASLLVDGELASLELRDDYGRHWTESSIIAEDPSNPIQPIQPGWLFTPNDPELDVPHEQEITVAVSDDVMNQALYEAFRAGATNIDLEKLKSQQELVTMTVGVLNGLLGTNLTDLSGIPDNLPVTVDVKMMLSPVLVFGRRGEDAIFQAHEVVVDIYLELEGTRQLLFSLVLDLDVPLDDLEVDIRGNAIRAKPRDISIGADSGLLPRFDFRIEEMPIVQLPFEAFRPLITAVTQLAMPFLLEVLADRHFAELSDLPLVDIEVWGANDHLYMAGRLDVSGKAKDNGGPPYYGDSVEKDKQKIKFGACGLTTIAGGSAWEFLLDPYREFRDQYLRPSGGAGAEAIDAYYDYSPAFSAALVTVPGLRAPCLALFVLGGFLLVLLLHTHGVFPALLALWFAWRIHLAVRRRLPALRALAAQHLASLANAPRLKVRWAW